MPSVAVLQPVRVATRTAGLHVRDNWRNPNSGLQLTLTWVSKICSALSKRQLSDKQALVSLSEARPTFLWGLASITRQPI
jgi:hypothetical protein